MDVYYRAEINTENDQVKGAVVFHSIYYRTFTVVRRTPKGVWVKEEWYSKERFILNDADKRYCYPTQELAINSLRRRQQMRVMHAQYSLSIATTTLEAIDRYKATGEWPKPETGRRLHFIGEE